MVFRVNNNLWQIRFVNPSNSNLTMSNGRQVLGLCDNNIKAIFIADNQSDYKTEHIICHEITHAICFEYDVVLPIETEEWLCNFMADHGKEIIYILDDLLRNILIKSA